MKPRQVLILTAAVVMIAVIAILLLGGFAKNDVQNWQVKQSITGNVEIIDEPGWYLRNFATVWTWPRTTQRYFSASQDEGGNKDESIRVTFNDGGEAKISTMIMYQMPMEKEKRLTLHQNFSGNPERYTCYSLAYDQLSEVNGAAHVGIRTPVGPQG